MGYAISEHDQDPNNSPPFRRSCGTVVPTIYKGMCDSPAWCQSCLTCVKSRGAPGYDNFNSSAETPTPPSLPDSQK